MSNNDTTVNEVQIIEGDKVTKFPGGRKRLAAALAALKVLDRLVGFHTGFSDLTDVLNAAGNYRPTLEVPAHKNGRSVRLEHHLVERQVIADAYDLTQISLGDERRAYRYSPPKKKRKPTYRRKLVQVGEG
jgi:hypothetical protein